MRGNVRWMIDEPIIQVRVDDKDRVLATLVSAFAGDPVERWLYPDDEQYALHFPRFLAAFGGAAFSARSVWMIADFAAVALWLPPDRAPDGEAIVAVLGESVPSAKLAETFEVLEQMAAVHPNDPHWYLPWLGVAASGQGQGMGSRLLTHGLATVDSHHLPAYLETPSPRTVPFYQRHGFELVGQTQAVACPSISLMLRPAR